VPPLGLAVALPSFPPKQLTLFEVVVNEGLGFTNITCVPVFIHPAPLIPVTV
jgi:hypothetical protein